MGARERPLTYGHLRRERAPARCRALVVSSDVLFGEEKQDCGDFRDQAWNGPASCPFTPNQVHPAP